ncbi:hypothetical protein Raf01_94430 [Rugosimonospora africana]|uniref:Uncharacterized protein n=1 Tax=Rugosimonospora africana TaxID=556532 RepID=A0A8J3R2W5_9ACTN|nr:hypothetical protein Raf01_94430 [Rugosimonospora africana]
MTSHDPDFWAKAGDVCGLYIDPPVNAVVWSVDEKTGMQAKSRVNPTRPAQPATPTRPGRRVRRTGLGGPAPQNWPNTSAASSSNCSSIGCGSPTTVFRTSRGAIRTTTPPGPG